MKRIWIAGVLAIGMHAVLLQLKFSNPPERPPVLPGSRQILVTLGARPNTSAISMKVAEADEKKPIYRTKKHPQKKLLPLLEKKRKRQKIEPEVAEPEHRTRSSFRTGNMISEVGRPRRDKPVIVSPLSVFSAGEDVGEAQGVTAAVKVVREAIPFYKKNPPPVYPRAARRRGLEGMVLLEVLVDRSGRVGNLRIFSSSGHRILDKAALKSVQKWRFVSARRGDEPVDMWVKVPVRFELGP
ncbi:MAG: energy transducer TonB [Thermodesulfobacteriota bacterium]|nr:energy transducer TonB [Thermodesulfobacteriota bacterium]